MIVNTGLTVSLALSVLLVFEVIVQLWANPKYLFGVVENQGENKKTRKIAKEYHTRALTLAGLVFTGLSILFTTKEFPELQTPLYVLSFSFSMFMISYQAKLLTQYQRIWFTIQDKTLSYGYIGLFLGVILLFYDYQPISSLLPATALVVVLLIRAVEVFLETRGLYRRRDYRLKDYFRSKDYVPL